MKKILLTGANGFIGQACLDQLIDMDVEVHAISRNYKKSYRNIIWHQVDIFDQHAMNYLISKIRPSHLLHLAWYTEPGKYWTSNNNFKWVSASTTMLQSFYEFGGERVVMAGSCAEYSWEYGLCTEYLTPLVPNTVYGVCKNSLQSMLTSFSEQNALSSAWGRVFFLFGPKEHPSRLFSSVIKALLSGKDIPCSSGNQIRDFMHVNDVASAFIALLDSNLQGSINIASGQGIMIKNVLARITSLLNTPPELIKLGALPSNPNDPKLLLANTKRLNDELGWQPSMSFDEALLDTIDWWKR
ncbi:NAD-dependent epimerase/dehydratase family protein [Francisella salimarina]|uniref:NAD(P)-dependent oxidoreductase n=1 Tax=Francisella salimarina TaxID=2599927 RepID=A0AAJ4TKX9_9GAMM|nr:NAD(P)-dependent oxidoreductase [Francisella salimarina]QWU99345.1 NAD(P)-dependent oxidoreductase [Francisella salimarina]